LHQQEFFQLKCKITSISGNFFHLTNEKWAKNLNLGFNVQSEESITDTVRFLDMTVTKAETLNVHSKWNLELKKSTQLILNDVSEINVILQSFDIIASDEFIHFLPILKLFQRPNDKNQKALMQYSGSELPLVHLRCNGFRVFLPNLHKSSNFNVLILKVNGLQITPNAVNNLIRTQILRPDIHSKASHLGVLDLVGSKIEDRQYQLLVKGCSLTSSSWNEITAIITEKNVENYDNPATIWNNFENGPSSPNFKFYTIFKDSAFSFIYAPCIKFKEVLVAGAAIEINCIENMNIVTSLEQMILFIDIGNQMKSIADTFSHTDVRQVANAAVVDERPKKFYDKKSFDDSGVASTISHSNQMKTKKFMSKKHSTAVSENGQLVPFEFTFTSSKFNLNFTIEEKNYSVLLDTPNLYITQSRNEKSLNISLYDLKIDCESVNIFTTRHGNIDTISGITPSLLRVKITEKSFKNTDLRVEMKRSIFLQITQSGIVECLRVLNILKHHSLAYENVKEIAPLAVNSKARKFDTIKSFMGNFKTLNITTDQIVTEFKSDKNHLKIGLNHLRGKLKLFDRPEKIETNFDVEHLTIQCENKLFLHPLSVETRAKITQEYWKKEPLIYLNVTVNYVKIDIWPDVIKQFHNFGDSMRCLVGDGQYLDHLNESENESDHNDNEKIQMVTNTLRVKNDDETVEHFLDDLRSGIYTFVELDTPFQELPLPYQIFYQDNSVICWRYPLPRALHKIKIFPVPFQTQNELKINCRIEYYSQLKSQFEELISLCLNENETKILDLNPTVPFSDVWRIKFQVNLKRDSDDDEEEAEIMNYLQMHPKVLLACLRIDSYYKPVAIPSISALLKVAKIQVNLMNENEERHDAIKCSVEELQIVSQHYDENCENVSIEGAVAVDIKDYGCDNLIPFIKNFQVTASIDMSHDDINLNFICNAVRLKYSSAIGHSLITTAQLWKQIFENSNGQATIESAKYNICNNTASTICINQSGTNEMIYVMPKSSKRYQFYTDKLKQSLQLSVSIQNDEWSEKTEAFCANQEGIQYVKVNDHQYFIVTVKNASNYQRKITIDGQVIVYNVTKENFTVQYKRYDKDIDTVDKCEVQMLDLDTHGNGSLFGSCEFDSQQTIRLHLKRSEKKAFSGEIPLREIVVNNKPWLVKIPLGTNNNFICFWVRIIRQNIDSDICRVLVLICPVFIAKSLFPSSIIMTEESTNDHYEIKGCGEISEIDMRGTHENEHKLMFPSQFVQQDKNPAAVTLSYKLINKNSFFKIPDEFSDITKAIEKIEEKRSTHWPCSRDEEVSFY
jgi:vacuolar protein sorting-associated protein 13B